MDTIVIYFSKSNILYSNTDMWTWAEAVFFGHINGLRKCMSARCDILYPWKESTVPSVKWASSFSKWKYSWNYLTVRTLTTQNVNEHEWAHTSWLLICVRTRSRFKPNWMKTLHSIIGHHIDNHDIVIQYTCCKLFQVRNAE